MIFKNRSTKIDGLRSTDDDFTKAELDAKEPEVHRTKMMSEAGVDGEIHMADGAAVRAELSMELQELEGLAFEVREDLIEDDTTDAESLTDAARRGNPALNAMLDSSI
jgi:hypothetical protein